MTTLYKIGPGGYWTGATQDAPDDARSVPSGWTARTVPLVPEGYYAKLLLSGWIVTDTPPPADPTPAAAPAPEVPRRVSVGAFFDRFGSAKWSVLADADPGVQAVIKDASVRQYIDLDNPDLPAGLAIVAARHDIDVDAILAAAVLEGERP